MVGMWCFMNRKPSAKSLAVKALCVAIVFLATTVLQIPIPLGYANLGTAVILILAVFWGPEVGLVAGGLGSALADLVLAPMWALPTLLVKAVMGLLCGVIAGKASAQKHRTKQLRTFLACIVAAVEMIVGYFIGGSILYGSVATGALQIPGLAIECGVGIVVFYLVGRVIERSGLMERIKRSD